MDCGLGMAFPDAVASHQAIEIVAVGAVGAERLLIKQAFDAAAQADLVGAVLEAHRPAHFAVPAAAENHYTGCAQSGGNHAEGP